MFTKSFWQYSLVTVFPLAMVLVGATCAVSRSGKGKGKGEERVDNAPAVGDEAPNFKLKSRDEKLEVELASFRGRKPVVTIFGSYT